MTRGCLVAVTGSTRQLRGLRGCVTGFTLLCYGDYVAVLRGYVAVLRGLRGCVTG